MPAFLSLFLAIIALIGCGDARTTRPDTAPMTIVCLGDSITGRSDLNHYLKWSHILECMIEASGRSGVRVLNRGIGGNTTGDVLQRLDADVLAERPAVAVVLIGGNDAGAKVPRETTRANLDRIVAALQGAGAKVLLLQYHLLPNPAHPETAWSHLPGNNDLIAATAAARGAALCSLAEPMREALARHAVTELVNGQDGVHLNPAGELVFARTVFAKLAALGWL